MDTQPAHTQSLSRAYSPSRNARPDVSATQTINAALMALWASKNAGVYTARAMKSLVVRHGAQPLSAEEFGHLTRAVTQASGETGIRTVLYDFRAAPTRCGCALCVLHNVKAPGVIAAVQDPAATTLVAGLRSFRAFESALEVVRPKQLIPTCVPCPLGIERVLSEVQERGGALVFGNYTGAVFSLPKQGAVYLHLSGDAHDEAAMRGLLVAAAATVRRLKATHLLIDYRQQSAVSLKPDWLEDGSAPTLTHGVVIAPEGQHSEQPADSLAWSRATTLHEALMQSGLIKPVRRERRAA